MVKILMHGCNGAMGQVICKLVKESADHAIVAGVDVCDEGRNAFPVFNTLEACTVSADVIIDFASTKAVDGLLNFCESKGLPVVICTTGLSPEQLTRVEAVSKKSAVLRSANMSLGVNLLLKLLQPAARILADADFDIEIVEKHHNQKVDAPSGTALALADSINEALDHSYHYQYDRSQTRTKREKKEIGIQSLRAGSIVGEHEVLFAGQDEVITFSHTAYSKAIFAKGAIQAAKFLAGKQPGFYTMADVIGEFEL